MGNINLRNVPQELHWELKEGAMKNNMTLAAYCLSLLGGVRPERFPADPLPPTSPDEPKKDQKVILAPPVKFGDKCPHDYANWMMCPKCKENR
jgi:hypothetical protein